MVEDPADHVLGNFKTQREAIDWAKKNGHWKKAAVLALLRGRLAKEAERYHTHEKQHTKAA